MNSPDIRRIKKLNELLRRRNVTLMEERDSLKIEVKTLEAVAEGLENPNAVELTPNRKQHLAQYLRRIAKKISGQPTTE